MGGVCFRGKIPPFEREDQSWWRGSRGGTSGESRTTEEQRKSRAYLTQQLENFRVCQCLSSRRLNTLNKCASMKLDVSHPKKKVRYFPGFVSVRKRIAFGSKF